MYAGSGTTQSGFRAQDETRIPTNAQVMSGKKDLAREVVRRNPDLILAQSNDTTLNFKAATTTIPIVSRP